MDLQTLKARAQAAREFTHAIGERIYKLRTPTRHDVLLASARLGGQLSSAAEGTAAMLVQRSLLEAAVIGWQGLRVGHLLPGDDEANAPLAWEPGAVGPVLDALPADEAELGGVLAEAMARRRAAAEADAKN